MRLAFVLPALASFLVSVEAISYRCENHQVLIVQSFGNDTIRMHCQKLDLCGNKNLKCNYDHDQPSCGGKNNFVSHVNQVTPTGPVSHTCCELQQAPGESILGHDGNDCFVYELPDGSHASAPESARKRKIHSAGFDDFTVLQNVNQIPEQIDGYVGYRMKLFMLRNKSPPSLLVKAIERLPEGYRVTICRPRCGNFHSEGVIGHQERTINSPRTISGDIMHGKVQSPAEWAAASWSSWSSSSWSSWSTSKFVGEEDQKSKTRGSVRGDRTGSNPGSGANAQSWNSGTFGSGDFQGPSPGGHNINVEAHGGQGGQGGAGGQGFGGSVTGLSPTHGISTAGASGTGVGVGVGGAGQGQKANGTPDESGGNGAGKQGLTDLGKNNPDENGLSGDNSKNKKPDSGDKLKKGDDENKKEKSDNDGSDDGDNERSGKNNKHKPKGNGDDGADSGDGKGDGDKATMIMEPDGSSQAINKGDEEDIAGHGGASGKDGDGVNGNGGKDSGDEIDGIKGNGLGGRVITGPSHLSSEKPETEDDGEPGATEKEPNGAGGSSGDGEGSDGAGGTGGEGDGNGEGPDGAGGSSGDDDGDGNEPNGTKGSSGEGDEFNGAAGSPGEGPNGADGSPEEGDGPTGAAGSPDDNEEDPNAGLGDGDDVPPPSSAETAADELARLNKGELGEDNSLFPSRSGENKEDGDSGDGNKEDSGDGNGEGENGNEGGEDGDGGDSENGPEIETDGGDGDGNGVDKEDKTGGNGGESEGGEDGDIDSNGSGGSGGSKKSGGSGGSKKSGGSGGSKKSGGSGGRKTGSSRGNKSGEKHKLKPKNKSNYRRPKVHGTKNNAFLQEPARQQTQSEGGSGGSGGLMRSCFSGDMEVTTVSGKKRMDELEIGDLILVPASGKLLKYEKVEMFYHREPETVTKFVHLKTESGRSLSLTPLHLLPFDDCQVLSESSLDMDSVETLMRKSKFAHRIQPGQCVVTVSDEDGKLVIDRVTFVGRKISKGIYSPMTVEGSLIANGVLASCFSQIESHGIQKLAYDTLFGIYNFFGYMKDAFVETQEIPSMLNYIHVLSRHVLPFAKY